MFLSIWFPPCQQGPAGPAALSMCTSRASLQTVKLSPSEGEVFWLPSFTSVLEEPHGEMSCCCWVLGQLYIHSMHGADGLRGSSRTAPEPLRGWVFSEQGHGGAVQSLGLVFAYVWGQVGQILSVKLSWCSQEASLHVNALARNVHRRGALGHPLWQGPGFHFLSMVDLMWCDSVCNC